MDPATQCPEARPLPSTRIDFRQGVFRDLARANLAVGNGHRCFVVEIFVEGLDSFDFRFQRHWFAPCVGPRRFQLFGEFLIESLKCLVYGFDRLCVPRRLLL